MITNNSDKLFEIMDEIHKKRNEESRRKLEEIEASVRRIILKAYMNIRFGT